MKKSTSFIALLGTILVPIIGAYAAVTLQKNVVTKEYILARSELRKNIDGAQEYIDELHSYFASISEDTDELEDILARIEASKSANVSKDTKIVLNYMEKLCLYTLVGNNDTYTPPENNNNEGNKQNNGNNNNEENKNNNPGTQEWKDINEATLYEMQTIQNVIDAKVGTDLELPDAIGVMIQSSSSNGSIFTLGYPDYGNLALLKAGYIDSFNGEYIISVLESSEGDYYQILGYLKKDENTKVAYIIGNYVKPNQYYPESLFVDPVSKNPILSGDEFQIK